MGDESESCDLYWLFWGIGISLAAFWEAFFCGPEKIGGSILLVFLPLGSFPEADY